MNVIKCNRLGHLINILLFMWMSCLVQSSNHETTTAGPHSTQGQTISSWPTSTVDAKDTMEKMTHTAAVDSTTVTNIDSTVLTTVLETSHETVNSDLEPSPGVTDILEIAVEEMTTFFTTSLQDEKEFETATSPMVGNSSSSLTASSHTSVNVNATEANRTVSGGEVTTSVPSVSSPGYGPNETKAAATSGPFVSQIRSIPELPRDNTTMIVTMTGDCKIILQDKNDFVGKFKKNLIDSFEYLSDKDVIMLDARCGSVVIEMMIFLPRSQENAFCDAMEIGFNFTYNSSVLKVEKLVVKGEPGVDPTLVSDGVVPNVPSDPKEFQQLLIFIVIGSVGGAFILLSFFLLCQFLAQKLVKASKKSYRPSDEPCIKLADFNMAHTYIPRPQSIYSATTRSSFLPYESMDQGYNFSIANPTPYVYADGDQIREHYQEVVEREPVTPTSKAVNDFGRSGIPSWDLPVLEGVVQEGSNASTLRLDDHKRATSSTFHAPPEDNIPPPPTASPPPPPPPAVEYHPPPSQRGAAGSMVSDDGSSHTEQSSSGDTRHLIHTPRQHDVGIDNPAVDIDNAYF